VNLYSRVKITKNIPQYNIFKDSEGTIVDIYDSDVYEVEIAGSKFITATIEKKWLTLTN
jgi:hypothetical protein